MKTPGEIENRLIYEIASREGQVYSGQNALHNLARQANIAKTLVK